MSRVQLALNVSDLNVAIELSSKLFGVEAESADEVVAATTRLAVEGLVSSS